VRKCEELYDMSNKYSGGEWKEKFCGQIGKELKKKSGKFQCFFNAHFKVIITEVLIINLLAPEFYI